MKSLGEMFKKEFVPSGYGPSPPLSSLKRGRHAARREPMYVQHIVCYVSDIPPCAT